MITKQQVIATASQTNLQPLVVEKDYVLGWMLWGISRSPFADTWVFKGGTCLKKCFFETYRFSEDLDSTLEDSTHLDESFLAENLSKICDSIYEETGIEFPEELRKFDLYENPRGKTNCQIKVAYRGPVSPPGKNAPRIKFDLSADEILVLPPEQTPVIHPYKDEPEGGIHIRAYQFLEAFGEKVRALGERTRPRDLYDVINLFRYDESRPQPAVLLDVLKQKCTFKDVPVPDFSQIELYRDELTASWENMLGHQLPALPQNNLSQSPGNSPATGAPRLP